MILALDPGERKIGWALVSAEGAPYAQGILLAAGWPDNLAELPALAEVEVVVIGDGTARAAVESQIAARIPQATLAVVNEKESTVEAWQLKHRELAGRNPLRALALTFAQLFTAPPVDDYAARVLALRYIHALREAEQ